MHTATVTELWSEELRLWTEGVENCRDRLAPHCLMTLPGTGPLKPDEALAHGKSAAWGDVRISRKNTSEHHGAVVLAYRARARQDGTGAPYMAWCTSCWVPRKGGWQMVQHQQRPETDSAPGIAPASSRDRAADLATYSGASASAPLGVSA
ncbi:hypothetical protein DL237_17080 [Pseudooceanicola sediminis]|uniref:DUF4440 domain-containing protein n=1 Tax=Pseudooceanicola sediminis TaxID=2211117 RepID=A0A399IWN4_9RHOB|nr:hypothetical protein [Pseudooceanicola sediminis]KAA2312338.1 hypothetical protein E0K93_17320 [Puniceibacterium sp. HSS470]RII37390.1 hypothetical protein DL237_17080 [Pseudooceanicola sediminis]|tara:strand:+ start:7687 stop:8139 length:453 start_codon:yes stop_codon:yes gene_type:complete